MQAFLARLMKKVSCFQGYNSKNCILLLYTQALTKLFIQIIVMILIESTSIARCCFVSFSVKETFVRTFPQTMHSDWYSTLLVESLFATLSQFYIFRVARSFTISAKYSIPTGVVFWVWFFLFNIDYWESHRNISVVKL